MPSSSGSSSAAAGTASRLRSHHPLPARSRVAASHGSDTGAVQDAAATAAAPPGAPSEATSEAARATSSTRRYCIKATSLTSAPKASAITTMAVAPPGEDPHRAAEPGSTRQQVSSQPSRKLTATTITTAPTNSGQ